MSKNDQPRLVELGANTREPASKTNLDVSGTVGPDHLGQETVDVDGHSKDRPGVRNRAPENQRATVGDGEWEEVNPEIALMDTGEELPVLLSSNMSADPIEGTQGSYTQIVEGECPRCGYDRLKVTVVTMAGEAQEQCNACGAKIDRRYDDGYKMPETEKDRARKERESGEKLGELLTRDVYNLETSGAGPYVSLVTDNGITRLSKDGVEQLFWMLVDNEDLDLTESIKNNLHKLDQITTALGLIPDNAEVVTED